MAFWDRCNHKWKIEHRFVFESPWQQMTPEEKAKAEPLPWMFRSKETTMFVCLECGKVRKETEIAEGGP
jgi:hypothetical protein